MDTSIKFEEFTEILKEEIQKRLGEEYQVYKKKVKKNNGIELTGMIAQKNDCNTSPAVYVNDLYREGLTREDIAETADSMCTDLRRAGMEKSMDLSSFIDFSKAKEHLVFKLIHAQQNEELLATIPNRLFLNLAIVYYYCVKEAPFHGNASILITNDHMEQWHTCEEELYEIALRNTPVKLPWKMENMEAVMRDLMARETGCNLPVEPEWTPTYAMYVLSNQIKLLGAACILYPDVLRQCAEELQGSFYVLPSSIHEVILIPEGQCRCAQELIMIVTQINETQVAPEEVLANSVYFYQMEEDKLVQLG